jgi:hypothetical protein
MLEKLLFVIRSLVTVSALAFALDVFALPAHATTYTWNNAGADWNTAADWTTAVGGQKGGQARLGQKGGQARLF